MRRITITIAVAALVWGAAPAGARHRQTPAIYAVTTEGDAGLPRVPAAGGLCFAKGDPGARSIFTMKLVPLTVQTQQSRNADDTNPSCATSPNRYLAWESSQPGPGTQLKLLQFGVTSQPVIDPTGTSANPAVNGAGNRVLFESTGDLVVGQNPTGSRQVFQVAKNVLTQLTHGPGNSGNAVISQRSRTIAYDSTNDPTQTTDTGVPQIWVGAPDRAVAFEPITLGPAASELPAVSGDGKVVVFQSRANLQGDLSDTGASQIFLHHLPTHSYAQLTDDLGGCTQPSVWKFGSDYRVAYMCGGQPFFTDVRHHQRYTLDLPVGSDTNGIVAEMGNWFLVVSTTGNLLGDGTTPGHQIYIWNLFKRPGTAVPGTVTWWPTPGLRPF